MRSLSLIKPELDVNAVAIAVFAVVFASLRLRNEKPPLPTGLVSDYLFVKVLITH